MYQPNAIYPTPMQNCVYVGRSCDINPQNTIIGHRMNYATGYSTIAMGTAIGAGYIHNTHQPAHGVVYTQPFEPYRERVLAALDMLDLISMQSMNPRVGSFPFMIKCGTHSYSDQILTIEQFGIYQTRYTLDRVQHVVKNNTTGELYGFSKPYTEEDCVVLESAVDLLCNSMVIKG